MPKKDYAALARAMVGPSPALDLLADLEARLGDLGALLGGEEGLDPAMLSLLSGVAGGLGGLGGLAGAPKSAAAGRDTLAVRVEKEHLVAELGPGQLVLLDTGSPASFGEGEVEWRGGPVDLSAGLELFPLEEIRGFVGLPLVGLIGADLLLAEPCWLDIAGGEISWGSEGPDGPGCPLGHQMRVPIVTLQCGDLTVPFAVDTGAVRTYVDAPLAEGLARVGTVDDFYPGFGPFSAEEVLLTAARGESTVEIRAAVLPGALGDLLSAMGIRGIVGLDVLGLGAWSLDLRAGLLSPPVRLERLG